MTDPTSSTEDETYAFVGPTDDGWYRTQIPDWIALCPKVNHTAYRLYVIVRSLILEKQPKKVRLLSHEQLAFLLPGPNGKPSGVRTIKDALQTLTEVGLVSNPDGERIVTSGGKGKIHTRRRYQLHDWPTVKTAMTVWRNSFDKLDAFTEDWRDTRTDIFPGQLVGRNSAPRTDQPRDTDPSTPDATILDDVSAGHFVGRNSANTGRDSARRRRNSARNADATSEDAPPLKQFPQGASSSSGTTETTPVSGGGEEEDAPSVRTTPSVAQAVMTRTGATADEADAVIESIEDHAERNTIEIGSIDRYVAGFNDSDLRRHLRKIRAQRAPEDRVKASQSAGPDSRCETHHEALPCGGCKGSPRTVLVSMLKRFGPGRRPDLQELFSTRPDLKNLVGSS
ncbi:hypothetical protein ABZ635_22600 [Nocardiopsis sp. NPDC007018]|uniref:hypothetical protein n=1 Tax=Nocardiopsis sp. NPDC007018 TaxID=3155721 RepID=UPI0033C90B73